MQVYFQLFANDIKQHYVWLKRQEDSPSLHVERRQWGAGAAGDATAAAPAAAAAPAGAAPAAAVAAAARAAVGRGRGRLRPRSVIGRCWVTSRSVGRGR